jgi:hypothetical protein
MLCTIVYRDFPGADRIILAVITFADNLNVCNRPPVMSFQESGIALLRKWFCNRGLWDCVDNIRNKKVELKLNNSYFTEHGNYKGAKH